MLVRTSDKITIDSTDGMLEADKTSIQHALERNKALREVARAIEAQKKQMLFAMGSFILEKAVSPKTNALIPFLAQVDLRLKPEDLTNLYLKMCEPEIAERWGEQLMDYPPGGGAVESAHELYARYYSFLLLQSAGSDNEATFKQLRASSSPELIFDLSDQGSVRATLSSFETDRVKWQFLVQNSLLTKLPDLYKLFDSLIAEQTRKDEDRLIQAKLEATYLKQFEQRFVKRFADEAALRRLFERFEAYVSPSAGGDLGSHIPRWGANILDNRESYVDGPRRSSVCWPEQYARDLALSESEKVFHDILALIPESTDIKADMAVSNGIANLEAKLEAKGIAPDVMLVGGDCSFLYTDEWSPLFVPDWPKTSTKWSPIPQFQGYLKVAKSKVPIFQVRTNQDTGISCLLSFRSGIEWHQHPPVENEDEQEYRRDFFFFRIVDLAAEKTIRDKIISESPVWQSEVPDKDRFLQQRIWLRVLERFEIVRGASVPGLKFRLTP